MDTDPRSPDETFSAQPQEQPGLTGRTRPEPDHGEDSYRGSGRLNGRRALITGGDSGIGRAVAIAVAREGADVAITHLPEEAEDAAATLEQVARAGRQAVAIPAELRDEAENARVVRTALEGLGGLDLLVLNAAYQASRDGLENLPTEELMRVFETNLFSPVWLARAAIPHLPAGAAIISTSSIQAAQPSPQLIDYAMTKAALVAFTKALAQELAPRGIRVNAVAPGPVWTPLIPATGWPDEEKVESFGSDTPLGRAAQPAELASTYVYLASAESSYVSGAVVPVTGGKTF